MIVPDANLLLYAYNQSSPLHHRAKQWWETLLSGTEPVGLVHPVLFSFLRIATSARAFPSPFTLAEASGHVFSWLDRNVTRVLAKESNHFRQVVALLDKAASPGGNLVTDAQVAAIAIAHNATVHTADRDFMRFKSLDCHYPLDEESG